MSEDDVKAILAAYRTGQDPDGEDGVHVRLVPFDEIKTNAFDLNIGRYVRVEAEEAVDLATALAAYQDAREARLEAEQRTLRATRPLPDSWRRGTAMGDWKPTPLGDVLTQFRDAVKVQPGTSYDLLGLRMWGGGVYRRQTVDSTTSKAKTLYRVSAGQFIYNRMFAWGGSFGVVPPHLDGSFVSNEFPVFVTDPERLMTEYLALHFQQPEVWAEVERASTGTTASRNRWKEDLFEQYEIRLPPLDGQRRVVDLMASVDSQIDALEVEAEAVTTAILALGGSQWASVEATVPLGRLGPCVTGATPSTKTSAYWDEPEVSFLTPGDINGFAVVKSTARQVSRAGARAGRRLEGPGVAVVCIGASLGKVGLIGGEFTTNQQINTLVGLSAEETAYLGCVLASGGGQEALRRAAGQTTMPLLNKTAFQAVEVPWNAEDQRADLGSTALSYLEARQALGDELAALRTVRSTLLTSLLNAEVVLSGSYDDLLVAAS